MSVPEHELRTWEWAALLHDVGKIGIGPPLLDKVGTLSGAEWAAMRQHPAIGERIVRTIPALHTVSLIVRYHHERWDGAGYPDRLAGPAIPQAARVITLADAYETVRAGRPYRPALTRDQALDELGRAIGTQFDPALAPLLPLLAAADRFP
jgi:HD-GYP domain-containing protein (c-di-GMP phosphodiesterase class II)